MEPTAYSVRSCLAPASGGGSPGALLGSFGEGSVMVTEVNRTRMTGMTEQSHFVPKGYLKGWSADGKRVWMYRLLVSTDSVPAWRKRSIRGIAFHQHLYTRLAAGAETDAIE